jgi:hypothetical protein
VDIDSWSGKPPWIIYLRLDSVAAEVASREDKAERALAMNSNAPRFSELKFASIK